MWGTIATWRMAHDGVLAAKAILADNGDCKDAVETAICNVEDYPYYKSVGYGGLPNERGIVELDAAFMDGDTFQIGAVAGITDVANPISVARKLSVDTFNSFRVGQGATEYAMNEGFPRKNMLTPRAKKIWQKRLAEIADKKLNPYDGHDTVCVVALDQSQRMAVGTSSSGLFMKKAGRVGDSPLSGSGFYADSTIGGAAATGLGEDLMKGCLSYEIVRLMGNRSTPQEACDQAVYHFDQQLRERLGKAGAFSLIAMNNQGAWGVATNVDFTFSVATEQQAPAIFMAKPGPNQTTIIEPITQAWLDAYEARIKAPV